MNYLAHAYFSFDHPEILAGNMISDFVKGKKQFDYPIGIQKGIRLHRAIDMYTDDHSITKEIKKVFSPAVRLYAGAFTDIVYDHFLAIHPNELSAEDWMDFTKKTYGILKQQRDWFPEPFYSMFPYMEQQNWLFNYRYEWGIENSFKGLVRRATYLDHSEQAFDLFLSNYDQIQELSNHFLTDVKKFAIGQFEEEIAK